jgi:hypothetical protein
MYHVGHGNWLTASQQIKKATICLDLIVNTPANPKSTNFHQQADRVACHIANSFHSVPYLALSGGLDSEYVAETLLRNQIVFVPIILKVGSLNEPEYKYAEKWCTEHNIVPHIVNIAPDKLLARLQLSIRDEFLTTNFGGFINVYLADYVKSKFNSYLITGSGDPTTNPAGVYTVEPELDSFYYWDVDLMTDILRPSEHPSPFIAYNPDILYSYMYNYDSTLPEQEAKAKLYNIPNRIKTEIFPVMPGLAQLCADQARFIRASSFALGTKEQTLKFLTKT